MILIEWKCENLNENLIGNIVKSRFLFQSKFRSGGFVGMELLIEFGDSSRTWGSFIEMEQKKQ